MYCGGTLGIEPARLVEILQQQTELEQREKTLEAQRLEELKAKNKNKNKEAANTDVVVQAKNKNKEAANTDVVQEVAPSMPAKKKRRLAYQIDDDSSTDSSTEVDPRVEYGDASPSRKKAPAKKPAPKKKQAKKKQAKKKQAPKKKPTPKRKPARKNIRYVIIINITLVFFNTPHILLNFVSPAHLLTDTNSKRTSPLEHRSRAQGYSIV